MRPIVCFIDSPLYNLSKQVSLIVEDLIAGNPYRLRDTKHFVTDFKQHRTEVPGKYPMSVDVVSLYTTCPMDEAIEDCMDLVKQDPTILDELKMLPEAFHKLLKLCVDHCYFEFDGHFNGPTGQIKTTQIRKRGHILFTCTHPFLETIR